LEAREATLVNCSQNRKGTEKKLQDTKQQDIKILINLSRKPKKKTGKTFSIF
jgi:hypothetical protein